ncbi:Uncharacterized conserved protein YndB, AHSA1/START domain [Aquiflexum balticum DSM 16537]|uniref:Uncharacterized conserved protein YndB, AHSA1/START domain n=1 Tax=Aquiflexum balticum DSM 16537 TaxID=758820 RepID=A0A1W2HB46_9BACT|nr:SRPBCC family protein [Aquiflexum balticum]SMD46093.1 Uncharacterized conserved protein YndB, AHSA1/START domain [Aquiflexum balticum DSM 16537]
MSTTTKPTLTVKATINASLEKAWEAWTGPDHITQWNFADVSWHCPHAENDLRENGKFSYRMEAKDGSFGFDFSGKYSQVEVFKKISLLLDDGRKVNVSFQTKDGMTQVLESFEAEETNSLELQQTGWQLILNNFKQYVESLVTIEKLHFEIQIQAPVEKVYEAMLADESYRKWTSVFNPGSHYTGSWKKGGKILFIGTDDTGAQGGMVSRVKENIPNKFVSIEHLGILGPKGEEITSGPEVEGWAGAFENYSFEADNGSTLLAVDLDSNQQFKSYFEETYPLALQKLKEICES